MPVALPVLSFSLFLILWVAFLPTQAVRSRLPSLIFVIWVGLCLLITAINALVWWDNTDIHIPVWCDLGELEALQLVVQYPNNIL